MATIRAGRLLRKGLLVLAATLLLAYILFPFAWTLASSFQTNEQLFQYPPRIKPADPWFTNYYAVFAGKRYGQEYQPNLAATWIPPFVLWIPRVMVNTFAVGFATVFLTIGLGAPAAYAFARFDFRGKGTVLGGTLVIRSVPIVAILIPLFVLMKALGLIDSLLGIVVVLTALELPFAIWILREYFSAIPLELEDAARIDGCSRFMLLVRIVMPLAVPGLIVTAIIVFMTTWSAFLVPLILAKTQNSMTLQVVAAMLVGERDVYTDYGLINAVAVVSIIPPMVLALIFQRYIMSGMFKGAIR
ncbi:MAG: carbohydrate ABC transporter permease [bacterium]|nr:carbohydrate ABC transporter permease [bacterium]